MKPKTNQFIGQPRNMSGWIRLAAAAKMANVSPDTLTRWIRRGEIPVSMRRQGPRLHFVNGPQFFAWRGLPSLYTREDLEKANDHCARGLAAEEVVHYVTGKPLTLEDVFGADQLAKLGHPDYIGRRGDAQ